MMFYTYMHTRLTDNKVFYIGKGTVRGKRAHAVRGRSAFWKRTVEKHGYRVDICAQFTTEPEAFLHERFLIACFRDLGAPLVNLTDGGEGLSGMVFSATHRARLAAASTGRKQTEDAKARIGAAGRLRKPSEAARAKMSVAGRGRPKTEAHKAKIAAANAGKYHLAPLAPGEHGPTYGTKLSTATREKMAAAHRGVARPAEVVAKIAAANTGKKRSPEVVARVKAARAASLLAKKQQGTPC